MDYKKNIFAFFIILCVLFCIAGASASDMNENITSTDNEQQIIKEINEKTLTIQDTDENTSSTDKSLPITVEKEQNSTDNKSDSKITVESNKVLKGEYFSIFLKDLNDNPIVGVNVKFTINSKVQLKTTDSTGKAGFKVNEKPGKYPIKISFDGNDDFNPSSKTTTLRVPYKTSVNIGNSIVLTKGYLRIYLKSEKKSFVSKKTLEIIIDGKKYIKTTSKEGFIVFKPNLKPGKHKITVKYAGTANTGQSSAAKVIKCIRGNVKNPLKSKIPLKKGQPNIDYMPHNYVMGDGSMRYTLTKSQYLKVIKKDSYSLFLNKKLSKFTFFKSKDEPGYNHIIKREKWNVIERAVNSKLVLKNNHKWWPKQISVNLKGKSYTYPFVRDVQNTSYTCGPTSASMCSQVLKNYVCEKKLSKQAGTSSSAGSKIKGIKKALENNHFKCLSYNKASFEKALNHLKKGNCALVFHTWNHFISILDISKDGKKVLVGNPSGDYNHGSHKIPTNWLKVKYMKHKFNNYDTVGLIVKLKYTLKKSTKNKIRNYYSNMGTNWQAHNTHERIPNLGQIYRF